MTWVYIALGAVIGLVILILVIGSLLPREHVASRSLSLAQAPEAVWHVITDYAAVPNWNAQIVKVERLPDRNGHDVWRETLKDGMALTLETTECSPPRRLVRTIADDTLPFRGRWEFEITPLGHGCRVTLTERGEIPNPFIRCMARLFMNPHRSIELYLGSLANRFQLPATIESVG
jgi:uncharacterized protein YndB with AHSA1/START domain